MNKEIMQQADKIGRLRTIDLAVKAWLVFPSSVAIGAVWVDGMSVVVVGGVVAHVVSTVVCYDIIHRKLERAQCMLRAMEEEAKVAAAAATAAAIPAAPVEEKKPQGFFLKLGPLELSLRVKNKGSRAP